MGKDSKANPRARDKGGVVNLSWLMWNEGGVSVLPCTDFINIVLMLFFKKIFTIHVEQYFKFIKEETAARCEVVSSI